MSVGKTQSSGYSVTVSQEQIGQARKLAEQRVAPPEAIDALLEGLTIARDQGRGQFIPAPIASILPPPNLNRVRNRDEVVKTAQVGLRNLLGDAGLTLSALYQNKELDVMELDRNVEVASLLRMFDSVRGLIAPPVMQRLDAELFAPLRNIAWNAEQLAGELKQRIHDPALRQRLQQPMTEFTELKPSDLEGHSLRGIDRYEIGDPIRFMRTPKPGQPIEWARGEVIGKSNDQLEVAFLLADGSLATKPVRQYLLERDNPLKIGDLFNPYSGSIEPGGARGFRVAVNGMRADGSLMVQADAGQGWFDLDARQIEHVAQTLTKQLGIAAPGSIDRAPEPTPITNGRQVLDRSGGVNMVAVESFEGEKSAGAVFTDRGIGYATYNEDAAAVGRFLADKTGRTEVSFSIACDQAGGHGKLTDENGRVLDGEASRIATQELLLAAQSIWNASKPGFMPPKFDPNDTMPAGWIIGDASQGADPQAALLAAVERAHAKIRSLAKDESETPPVTTASAVVVKDGWAYGVNIGDSAVILYDKNGRIKQMSHQDSAEELYIKASGGDPNAGLDMSSGILRGIGQPDSLKLDAKKDVFAWKLEPGDYLVTASDGLLDANLMAQKKSVLAGDPWSKNHGDVTMENIGTIISRSSGASEVAGKLLDWTTIQMTPDDPQGVARAKAAFEAARHAGDADACSKAYDDEVRARGSGKPDNRGFGVLQYLG
jgi:serine/threonine protein phosphatase PrpC